eukprot:Gb_40031 [translate_table: standard]
MFNPLQIITSLPPPDTGADLSYHSLDDQLALLTKVLNAGDDAVGLEQLEEDADDITLLKARRSVGSMSAMSGASGMVYMEYRHSGVVDDSLPLESLSIHSWAVEHKVLRKLPFLIVVLGTYGALHELWLKDCGLNLSGSFPIQLAQKSKPVL